ncbi:MAG: lipoprotein signal peptidase [Leptospiraceae bacterium]|nr:lipoprotein signal peptidase [Leptospiraceae bacterium]
MPVFKKSFWEVFRPSYLIFIAIGVFIDLLSKYLIVQNFKLHDGLDVFGGVFRITLTFNTGYVFGLFQDNLLPSIITTGIAIIILFIYRLAFHDQGNAWGWNLVLVGAFGNFIDKFFVKMPPGRGIKFGITTNLAKGEYAGVVDFLDFDWPDFLYFERWPAFNFADSCISVGLVILIISMHLEERRKAKEGIHEN